ncbi:MAG: type II toxin-antitoxin system RelE/ParE family toxin [Bifidobacteriaceae bacterium]|jgi:proteic killer suppression protein|nr:type II toxin-antitoxin system RelE/ParE family toxin [Bifidobacteriaceae bacterium]
MIGSFGDRETERLWRRQPAPSLDPRVARTALRKLAMLDAAITLGDLASPPGNRLEVLKGRLAGSHSIRVNDQWRVVFVWAETGPQDVRIVDYH